MAAGIARSIVASMIAWTSIEPSQDLRRTVSGVPRRLIIGVSISSADDSKNEMTVLSELVSNDIGRGPKQPYRTSRILRPAQH